jgi:hypothetical protein
MLPQYKKSQSLTCMGPTKKFSATTALMIIIIASSGPNLVNQTRNQHKGKKKSTKTSGSEKSNENKTNTSTYRITQDLLPLNDKARVRETQHTTDVVTIPLHTTSLTVDESGDLSNTSSEQMCGTSMTVPTLCIAKSSLQPGKEGVDPSSSISPDKDLSQNHDSKMRIIQQNVQTTTLDDLNPHGLYPHHDTPLPTQLITVIYDSGASITMLPGAFADSWRKLRPSLMQLSGAFATENQLQHNLSVGEFHAELTLDDGEKIRAIFPEAVSLPSEHNTYISTI